MKIAVCTLHINDWYTEVVKYSIKNMGDYCKKHNYDFIVDNSVDDKQRDCPWYKIKLLLKILEAGIHDIVVWIDADSHIMNSRITLESIMTKYMGDKDILLSREVGNILNTGVMFVKNSEFCKMILEKTWDNKMEFRSDLHEQASLGALYEENIDNSKDHIVILEPNLQNVFLTYWFSYYPTDCFIFHATRCSHEMDGFIFLMDRFCPIKMDEETDEQYKWRMNWLTDTKICRDNVDKWLNGGQRADEVQSARITLIPYLTHLKTQAH